MELTLNIPKQLTRRLRPHQDRLVRIIELGLDALEAGDCIAKDRGAQEVVEEPIPPEWSAASDSLATQWQESHGSSPPSHEELQEYLLGDLGDAAADGLRERLMAHPMAIEDLLTMEKSLAPDQPLEDLQPPDSADLIADAEVGQAWRALRMRLDAEGASGPPVASGVEDTATGQPEGALESRGLESRGLESRGLESKSNVVKMPRPLPPRKSSSRAWLYLAASLLLTTGGFAASTAYHQQQLVAPVIAKRIEINNSRGPRPYRIEADVEQVLLLVSNPQVDSASSDDLELILTARGGKTVYRKNIKGLSGGGGSLHLTLPHEKLPSGEYRLEILDPVHPNDPPVMVRTFAIESR